MRKRFKFLHSILGLLGLIALQAVLVILLSGDLAGWAVLLSALAGSIVTLYVATEVIEEVRSTPRMLEFLSLVVAEFIVFFAFEYWFLGKAVPMSFSALSEPVSLLLQSTMVFVFNPLYAPLTTAGKALLLINTVSSLGLVLFILQNIWQIRREK